jgi:stress response protein SCP2
MKGSVKDVAFYNNLTAANGAVVHSGDNKTGEGEGDDESIKINVDALPVDIKVIMFVVTAYSGGTFEHLESAKAHVRDLP